MAPGHQLLCKKSVFKKTSVCYVLLWADVQFVGECVCFFYFSIYVISLSPLSIWYLSMNILEAMEYLLGHTVKIIRLIAFQSKRQFHLVKWCNLKDF